MRRYGGQWIKWVGISALLAILAGCATTSPSAPRELVYAAPVETTLRSAVELMMEQGYVIRHADLALGRAEASLARWPEYRLQLQVSEAGGGSRVSVAAWRGSQPLPPYLLDPWLVSLQAKLGLAP
ncbi:hypothetical protein [Vreelandella populi]|uniref:Uncharacterized protein n=1 Tax=Vreelandella populi TaxID=2498858 RepID=A0A433L977_9GAMM|nr:hypothetical protein [Halomonas populi]RUR36988.1 hypothetical protein ELY25_12050 [Halomonas populi]RUR44041.1 hypothetical protein ELY37_15600 [Halomonas populi]RUR53499.1 hypothetical protein ELY40_10975 [Halomonas populi]